MGHSAAQSSFFLPMQLLRAPRRRALRAVYAFCRAVDDIADEPGEAERKHQALDAWQQAIEAKDGAMPEALRESIQRYQLPTDLFIDMLEGMRMDVDGKMHRPSLKQLDRYCYCVAGTVGILAMRVFGCHDVESMRFAYALAQALQRINILRDLQEDAQLGRLYLPNEWLNPAPKAAQGTLNLAELQPACQLMAISIADWLRQADRAATTTRWRWLPAYCMAGTYLSYLKQLQAANFQPTHPLRLHWGNRIVGVVKGMYWCARGRINAQWIGVPAR